MKAIKIDYNGWFYKNCVRQRRNVAKICQVCPFRSYIEEQETKRKIKKKIGKPPWM